ncbi:MAG: hypothetical protein ABL899_01915, partial [Nitrospira sp.]
MVIEHELLSCLPIVKRTQTNGLFAIGVSQLTRATTEERAMMEWRNHYPPLSVYQPRVGATAFSSYLSDFGRIGMRSIG